MPEKSAPDQLVRLSKRMSELGICSRREADQWIEKGLVLVDGKVVDQLGTKVLRSQKVELQKEAQKQQQKKLSILLHKPVGYVSHKTEKDYPTASSLLVNENQWERSRPGPLLTRSNTLGLAPVGRLDIDSKGLMLFTQDGRLAKQLIGENSEVEKEYVVKVRGELTTDKIKLLCHGLQLDGKDLKPAKVSLLRENLLQFILIEGKKRQIRRMCEAVELDILSLKRTRIGKIKLGDLKEGCWRFLEEEESFV